MSYSRLSMSSKQTKPKTVGAYNLNLKKLFVVLFTDPNHINFVSIMSDAWLIVNSS